jgi:competence protein ComEA
MKGAYMGRKLKWKNLNVIRLLIPLFAALLCMGGCSKESVIFTDSEETKAVGEASEQSKEDASLADGQPDTDTDDGQQFVVYVCGAVKHPGVYTFEEGQRVCDAIEAAGGMKKKAAAEALNLARELVDGEQIIVPTKKEQADITEAAAEGAATSGKVNINTASKEELMTLSGIGEAKAQSILSYREKNGQFSSIEDIMKIDGIKEGVFSKIEDSICIN